MICDDSRLARKQMANALCRWNIEVTFAEHGLQALEAIRAGKGDLLFLDLNMPIMDGYQVLERIRRDDLKTLVIVVSGDVQPAALQRVMNMGALDFVSKPTSAADIGKVLQRFGILQELEKPREITGGQEPESVPEYYQEIANIAMGRAGDLLARLLGVYVSLPIPHARMVHRSALEMHLFASERPPFNIVGQGFIGGGIAGEALIQIPVSCVGNLAGVMGVTEAITSLQQEELMMEVANTLTSAFLGSFAQQLKISLSRGTPTLIESDGFPADSESWQQSLAITIDYQIESDDIHCELLVIFTEDSLPALKRLLRAVL
ncbi:response regulator [Marinobacterium jannaschii]|uniref:response regulator n=1 Tax=Marinobacterium jannaschii TaxID=64970 RepID=UPI002480D126|nr:response regulator [Marinobacterium jannaschii]